MIGLIDQTESQDQVVERFECQIQGSCQEQETDWLTDLIDCFDLMGQLDLFDQLNLLIDLIDDQLGWMGQFDLCQLDLIDHFH